MFINFFRGELNIVGVRPLSEDYFSRYPKDLQEILVPSFNLRVIVF